MKKLMIAFCSFTLFLSIYSNEKLLFAIVTSYNNAAWAEECLNSIFYQDYKNYHVIYIDDASTDKTSEIVKNYISDHNFENKCTFIINAKRRWKLINIYNAYHSVPDDAIILQVDGDDTLAHNQVFKKINQIYQDENIWMTYGQFKNKDGKMGYCKAIPSHIIREGNFRRWEWVLMHLRTFYAWLFKAIKIQDFFTENVNGFRGKFYPYANDNAMMFPMVEMARYHFKFIPEVLYIRNLNNPLNGLIHFTHLQREGAFEVRSKPAYPEVKSPIYSVQDVLKNEKADILFFSTLKDEALISKIEESSSCLDGIRHVFVCNFKDFYKLSKGNNLELIASDELYKNLSNYVLLMNDQVLLQKNINCNACIQELERTYAYAFYCGLSADRYPFEHEKLIPFQDIFPDLNSWKFKLGEKHWREFNNTKLTLYRKQTIKKIFALDKNSIHQNLLDWIHEPVDLTKAGLFFNESKLKIK